MQPFILWQKVEPPYIFGILSNFKKVQIGYLDSYGNKVYYASYYEYEDIADDYEPEQEPNSSQNFTGADWNRYQQRKYYKNLRENLNNSSNPEYTRPQHLANDIQFASLQQHNNRVLKGVSDLMSQAQERQQAQNKKVLKGVVDIYALRQQQEENLRRAKNAGNTGYGMSYNDNETPYQPMLNSQDKDKYSDAESGDPKKNVKNISDVSSYRGVFGFGPYIYFENKSSINYYVKPEDKYGEGKNAILVKPGQIYVGGIDGFASTATGIVKVATLMSPVATDSGVTYQMSIMQGIIYDIKDVTPYQQIGNSFLDQRHNEKDYYWDELFEAYNTIK